MDRLLRSSNVLDLEKLCIEKSKSAWLVNIFVECLDDCGNLNDAALLSVTGALGSLSLPAVVQSPSGEYQVDPGEFCARIRSLFKEGPLTPLELNHVPIAVSMGAFSNDKVIVDLTDKEAPFIDRKITIVCTASGLLCGVTNLGGHPLKGPLLQKCIALARNRAQECFPRQEQKMYSLA